MTDYVSKPVNEHGLVAWRTEENKVWHDLVARQLDLVQGRACKEYLRGLEFLDLPLDRAPQLPALIQFLLRYTGWQV